MPPEDLSYTDLTLEESDEVVQNWMDGCGANTDAELDVLTAPES